MTRRHGREHLLRALHRQHLRRSSRRATSGYVLAHMFALSGFVLLRQGPAQLADGRSSSAGSGRRSPGMLAVWCLILTIVGFGWFQNAAGGYGGTKEKMIGVGVLVIGARCSSSSAGSCRTRSGSTGVRRRRRCPRGRRPPSRLQSPGGITLRPAELCARGSAGRHNRLMSSDAPPPREFEIELPGGFSPGRARRARRLRLRRRAGLGADRRRRSRQRPGDRLPAHARHVRDGRHRADHARRRPGARDDRERLHVRLAEPAARAHLARPPQPDVQPAPRGQPVRGQRARPGPDGAVRLLRPARAARGSSRSSS